MRIGSHGLQTGRSSRKRFSRFVATVLVLFTVLALTLVLGPLYGLITGSMEHEFYQSLRAKAGELGLILQERLSLIDKTLRELSLDNVIRVSLMLGVRPQLEDHLEKAYSPQNGAIFLVRERTTNRLISSLPELTGNLKKIADQIDDVNHLDAREHLIEFDSNIYAIFSSPIMRKAESLGTAYAIYSPQMDRSLWKRLQAAQSGHIFLLHHSEIVDIRTGERFRLPPDTLTFLESHGHQCLKSGITLVPIKGIPNLIYGASTLPLREKQSRLAILIIVLCISVFGINFLAALLIAKKLDAPLRGMADQAKHLAFNPSGGLLEEGGLKYQEFTTLVRAFNSVLTKLIEAQEALKEETRQALEESERMYRNIFEYNGTATILIEKDGTVAMANGEFEKLTGYSRKEIEGRMPWLRFVTKEDLEAIGHTEFEPVRDHTNVLAERNFRLIKKDGQIRWIHVRFKDIEGTSRSIASLIDITKTKRLLEALSKSEARYRGLYESVPVGLFRSTPEGKILEANKTFLEILACPDKETLATYYAEDFWLNPAIVARIEKAAFPLSIDMRTKRLDGKAIWLRWTATPRRGPDGLIAYYEGTAQDITKERQLEEQLRHAQNMEALGTLAGGIAHDFNNILAVIFGEAEMTRLKLPEDSPLRGRLSNLMTAARRARDLVLQILTFSRLKEDETRPILLSPIIKESLKLLRASLPAAIEIRESIEPEDGVALANPTHIHQVIMNLCTNAGYAMRENGGVLAVELANITLDEEFSSAYPHLESGPYFRLAIRDTGVGIPPEIRDRIFEPYFTTKEKGTGTGLGLSVVHGIVKSLGGEIVVESEVGKGSAFTIYIPRVAREAEEQVETSRAPLPRGHELVLLVDDEPSIAEVGREMLEHLGYQVVTATTPAEALERFKADPDAFNLLITDLSMPQMSGDKLARVVLSIRPGLPIILCTGFTDHITEKDALQVGVKALLNKPLTIKDLAHTVRDALVG